MPWGTPGVEEKSGEWKPCSLTRFSPFRYCFRFHKIRINLFIIIRINTSQSITRYYILFFIMLFIRSKKLAKRVSDSFLLRMFLRSKKRFTRYYMYSYNNKNKKPWSPNSLTCRLSNRRPTIRIRAAPLKFSALMCIFFMLGYMTHLILVPK